VEEQVKEEATAVAVKPSIAEDVREAEDEEAAIPERLELLPNTGVYAPLLVSMSSTMGRREQQTRCVRPGRRLYTTLERYTDTI
jgi:hypothetical protein